MLHLCSAPVGNLLRSYYSSGHGLHLLLCSALRYSTCRVSLLLITWEASFHNFQVCEQWQGGKAWSYNPLRYEFFTMETANRKIFGQYLEWEGMFTKCYSILRILAVLGLFVPLKVVKDGRWQEKAVTEWWFQQPANDSPAGDPSYCTDPTLPVTHSSFHPHFPDVPREVPVQTPCAVVLVPQPHLQEHLLWFLSNEGAAPCFPTDLTQIMSSPSHGALSGSTMPKVTGMLCWTAMSSAQCNALNGLICCFPIRCKSQGRGRNPRLSTWSLVMFLCKRLPK